MSTGLVLAGARLVAGAAVAEGDVRIADGRIAAIGHAAAGPGDEVVDLAGRIVTPGFIDLHVHGGDGAELLGAGPEEVARVLRFHAGHGTTGLLATTVSAAAAPLRDGVQALAAAGPVPGGAAILGLHLEGPYLNRERRGAQDPRHVRDPDPAELDRLLDAGADRVRIVTLAPELPGAHDAIRRIVAGGAVAGLGHSDATYEQALAAFDAGARHATHLFNGMRPLHHREPGLAGAALECSDITCELIADGEHVHPAAVRLAHRLRGPAGVALITDAMQAAGLGDGRYRIGDLPVRVQAGRAVLEDGGSLAGSTLTMGAAVRNAVAHMGLPLADAVAMAATTPARVLGIDDRTGAIAEGHDADLVVLDAEDLRVLRVMIGGRWI